jgi:hypothetical protein
METNDFVSYCHTSELSQTWSLVGDIRKTFMQASAQRASSSPRQVAGAHINDIPTMT